MERLQASDGDLCKQEGELQMSCIIENREAASGTQHCETGVFFVG
jgi:hypothetical protein